MSEREPGDHPYARAYAKASGKRTERAFVPPFRAPADGTAPADDDAPPKTPQQDDPDKPRRVVTDDGSRGYGISRAALVLVALALGLGLLIGRVSVNNDPATVAQPTPTATKQAVVPLGPTTLRETGSDCAVQRGKDLVLGVEVRNFSTAPVKLERLGVHLPASGLTLAATGVGACGEIGVPLLKDFGLPTQGTVWLSTTLRVTTACPADLPVSMTVYAADLAGNVQPISIAGFKNLQAAPWSGCTGKSAQSGATTSAGTSTGTSAGKSTPATSAKSTAKKKSKR